MLCWICGIHGVLEVFLKLDEMSGRLCWSFIIRLLIGLEKNEISVFIFDYFDLLEICMRLNLNVNIGIKFVVIQVTL